MAYSYVQYAGNGSTTTFAIPFTYISKDYLEVKVNNVLTTAYSLPTSSTLTFTTAPPSGQIVEIRRNTPKNARLVDFQDASILTEAALDLDSEQAFQITQEAFDLAQDGTGASSAANAAAAAASAANAAASYDSFDDRYLGPKSTNPALDNDGAALLTGALYFNTTANVMRVYTGTIWIDATIVQITQNGAGAVARNTLDKIREGALTVTDFSTLTIGDGVTSAAAAVALANTAANTAGSSVTYPAGVYLITTNTTLTSPVRMMPGARFKVSAGVVLTIDAPVYAGTAQYIFEGASGAVTGTFGYIELWADWFGAVPDGSFVTGTGTDSGIAINKALVACHNGGTKYGAVRLNPGIYMIMTGVINSTAGVDIRGAGKYVTILVCRNDFVGRVIDLAGPGGPPSTVSGMGVVAQINGAFGADGIVLSGNGSFAEDVWVNGFASGVRLANTDVHLTNFVSELSQQGIYIASLHVTVADGVIHNNIFHGVLGENLVSSDAGSGMVHINNVRSTDDNSYGFRFVNVDNVNLNSCSVNHNNGGEYYTAGFSIEGTSKDTIINGCAAVLATQSVAGIGFNLGGLNATVTACTAKNFYIGAKVNNAGNTAITNGDFNNNVLCGIEALDYNYLTLTGNQTHYNGTAAAADGGILITANRAFQRLLINGNQCGSTGGGAQEYGIRVTCTVASSYGLVANNIASFATVNNILIDGVNAANITQANNIVV